MSWSTGEAELEALVELVLATCVLLAVFWTVIGSLEEVGTVTIAIADYLGSVTISVSMSISMSKSEWDPPKALERSISFMGIKDELETLAEDEDEGVVFI